MKKIFSLLLICVLAFSTLSVLVVDAAEKATGTLTIHKFEQEKDAKTGPEGDGTSNQEVPQDAKSLEGVTFEVKQIESFEKISNDGKVAKEDIKHVADAKPIQVTTTDKGIAEFKDLPLGRYEVKEIAGPAHINLNKDTYKVDIPMTSKDGKELNYDVHIYPKNETKRGAVELTKKGAEDKALAGAEFRLVKEGGTVVKESLVTGKDGKIRVEGLEYGEYYFEETKAPEGYIVSKEKQKFSITESGTLSEDGAIGSGKIETKEVTNYQEPTIEKSINGDAKILAINPNTDYQYDVKTLIPEDIKDYKKYVVTDILDERLAIQGTPVVKIDGKEVDSSLVEVVVEGQKVTATIKDFSKVDGSKELHLQITAQIKEGVEQDVKIPNTATIDFTNKEDVHKEGKPSEEVIVTPTLGNIALTKVDGKDNKVLSGAEFELQDKYGKVVKVKGQEVKGTSDKDGLIKWNDLPYGEYQIVETKAPTYEKEDGTKDSYQKLRNPIDVKIDSSHKMIELTVENNKNGWIIPATGGMGTIFFTVVGLMLMGAAAVIFFRKKAVNN
ncbi:adhesin [Bacillus thuringiensis serovar kyushuensis]|uniref:SpaA isopeptide-forming pilin-related protein n=1 Tax=Bacillus thuringiensis TaxID=1428 RepID=UPI000B44D9D5|nr:SpaA isopeptide-forming pilin-related protein [Bacillus thuringiensis]MEC2864371.1 SpaA isopeptide-forming pilin-related protein [Bacillus cereus]OTZ61007.1 adhesin [Bacillus thuringiensis serovar kyushuensis]OTZ64354.1 adhesin [Bacillus thuringiensis serovar tohokuensis]OUB88340.1 adhesin [Bacillus thuringiensis serovar indiana]